ncbi:TetR/AcrR family transcriptional regulator [Antrihabitans stalactiti]|uniref:TetR/AcrR family transcriptional regulator n=1 Tax=Antrihabitans stalactiti TaxID=2584121 RepID=A0A848KIU1_9NOCA|nr:TetR family transcriptional regulator [Antrihabitans stalactiti]NMN97708.1 TetR/AcrR family transcriptional regulator [Antrihabitans stalactiti]
MRSGTADLTTRARIRDAAIVVFGEQGFGTGVRAVATAAGVSPGLVNHHFGSKDGLREVCDAYVLDVIRTDKAKFLTSPSAAGMIAQLAEIDHYAPMVAYIIRSFQAGGALALSLFEHLTDNAALYLEEGVAAGTLRPSRDPAARARYAALQGLGGMLLFFQLKSDKEGAIDYTHALREYSDATTFPALELYTYGMLTDSTLFEALVDQRSNENQEDA